MHSEHIKSLIDSVENEFGKIQYYGSSSQEEHGVAFKLPGIEATFSVITLDGELKTHYDVQIEGMPAGDYVFVDEVSLDEFIELVRRFQAPDSEWP